MILKMPHKHEALKAIRKLSFSAFVHAVNNSSSTISSLLVLMYAVPAGIYFYLILMRKNIKPLVVCQLSVIP